MRVFQTASILAAFGCLVTLAGARVPKSHDDGSAKADIAVRAPAGTHTLDEAGLPTPPPPPPRPKAICCMPGCTGCTIRWCNVNECPDLLFNDCCAEEKLADAKFYDYDGQTELNVTLAEVLAHVSSEDAAPHAGIDAVQGTKPSVPDAEDKSLMLALKAPRAPSKETPICCTPGCLACTTEVCDKGPCTASIFFAACCATQLIVPDAKFYDPDHNELNITRAEFLAMVEAGTQGTHN